MSDVITLRRLAAPADSSIAWEASIRLPPSIPWRSSLVNGTSTSEGPWLSATGQTADEAYAAALRKVGMAVIALSEHVPPPQKGSTP